MGPNKVIKGILAKPNICITPLSTVIAFSNLVAKVVTKTGEFIFETDSGNNASVNFFLNLIYQIDIIFF